MKMLMMVSVALAVASVLELAMATNFTVGAPGGSWDQTSDLRTWAKSQTFKVGDNLIFQYSGVHDVLEVTKKDYDSCQSSNAILTDTSGNTVIPLTKPGTRYFICGTVGHCTAGMKLAVPILATSSPTAAPAPSEAISPATSPAESPSESLSPTTTTTAAGPGGSAPAPVGSSANKVGFGTLVAMSCVLGLIMIYGL